MDNCFNCGKELIHTEGRRQKKYCDEVCKGQYFRKVRREPKYVQFSTFKELKDKFDELTTIAKNTPLGKKVMDEVGKTSTSFSIRNISPIGETISTHTVEKPDVGNSEILAQIAVIEAEKIPPERNTSLGKRVWQNEKDAKIRKLKSQLR